VRLLGCLAAINDAGIPIHIFTGNHDLWMQDYLTKEIGASVYFSAKEFTFSGKQFFVAHGDGLGPGDEGYKFLKKYLPIPYASGCLDGYIQIWELN